MWTPRFVSHEHPIAPEHNLQNPLLYVYDTIYQMWILRTSIQPIVRPASPLCIMISF